MPSEQPTGVSTQAAAASGSRIRTLRRSAPLLVLLAWTALCLPTAGAATWEFDVRFDRDVRAEPFTGRVYIFFSKRNRQPRFGPNWFRPELFIARDVENWRPGRELTFSSKGRAETLAFPVPLAKMKLAGYRAQAVARFNPLKRRIGTGAGNGYSDVVRLPAAPGEIETAEFSIDKLVPARRFPETRWSKLLQVRSRLLSDFHGRDVTLKAAVILPASYYDQPNRRYPTIFNIPGFGGTHFRGVTDEPVPEENKGGVEFLRVMLDASCPLGHHVFADSANNGPYGTAFIEEFLPEFDGTFRSIAEPTARFLTGHSSGGWSSLWVQINWPEHFAGTWSTAPDPVDFRDFQQINLYRPGQNMYYDAEGNARPLARRRGEVVIWYKDFAHMERVLGHGGQLHSFEAVFSPRGNNGKPMLLWDRPTGAVDTDVARSWKKYDIRLVLQGNWKTLGPKLQGKLHIHMGDRDTFYLEGATILLKQTLKELESDAVVEIHPGKDHGSLLDRDLRDGIRREMVDTFLREHPAANE